MLTRDVRTIRLAYAGQQYVSSTSFRRLHATDKMTVTSIMDPGALMWQSTGGGPQPRIRKNSVATMRTDMTETTEPKYGGGRKLKKSSSMTSLKSMFSRKRST